MNEMFIIVYIAHDLCFRTYLNARVEVANTREFMSVCLFEKLSHWHSFLSIHTVYIVCQALAQIDKQVIEINDFKNENQL